MSEVSPQTIEKVAAAMFDSGLLKFGEFTLKSGLVSPFYIDLRQAQSFPDTFAAIINAYGEMLADADESVFLAGVPEAATPLAAALGYKLHRKLLQPRKVVKDHGTKSSVEGAFEEGDKVVLVDDLITKGDSKLEAIAQVEDAGLVIEKFIVLVDREQGGLDMIREKGYVIEAAFGITKLIESLYAQSKITKQQHDTVLDFIKNN
ncbi:orotate phosphoribosyltransferase [Patescibacteria group bacterium]|nr:MAG: orotate phosphoribosyltransferase [Patescibacteria group bacterium]